MTALYLKQRKIPKRAPLKYFEPREPSCFEIVDSSALRLPATFLLKGNLYRDSQAQAARLSQQFIRQNRGLLGNFGITIDLAYNGTNVDLILKAGIKIGAIPLLSPTTGKPDYGLIIKPRFNWSGIGPMLGEMGWRVIPSPLKLPLLPRSDRKIPPWVLSTIILFRIQAMLKRLERRFEYTEADMIAPRGTVNWSCYVTKKMSSANFLQVPCRYPDLRDDRELLAAIHFTLRKQLASLETQKSHGIAVVQLIVLCQSILERVQNVPAKQPTPLAITSWLRGPLRTEVFRDGLQAVEWTIEDRGLAGLSDLQGLPWVMSMEEFFEAWVETVVEKLAKQIGGILKTGRKRETISPLIWNPPYLGSQKYLLPDLILEREDETIIIDAKYKSHWEDMNRDQWSRLDEELKERHRADLLQVLAYSTLSTTKKIVSCLVYPCTKKLWESLKRRKRSYHHASVYSGSRKVNLILIAIPMETSAKEAVNDLANAIRCVA
jgi:hypothetical protein